MKKPLPEQLKEAKEARALALKALEIRSEKLGGSEWVEDVDGPALETEKRALTDAEKLVERLQESVNLTARSASWTSDNTAAPGVTVNVITDGHKDKDVAKNYRLVRAIRGQMKGRTFDGLELEMHQEGLKEARTAGIDSLEDSGIMVPGMVARSTTWSRPATAMNEAERRDLTVGTAGNGGYTVQTMLGELIPFLDPAQTLLQLGATYLSDLVGNLDLPRRLTRATAVAVAEQGALTESTPTFDKLSLTPKRQGTYIETSLQLIQQSSIGVENLMRMDLFQAIAELWEMYAINGSGSSNQPTGILATSGIGSVVGGTNGAVPDWADIVDLETALNVAKALRGMTGYLTTPGLAGKLKKTLVESAAGSEHIWEGPNDGRGTLNGYKAMTSTLVPSTLTKGSASGICHALIFGNWRELILASWGGVQLIVNPYSLDTTGSVRITANAFFDVGVRHAASFAAMQDALIS